MELNGQQLQPRPLGRLLFTPPPIRDGKLRIRLVRMTLFSAAQWWDGEYLSRHEIYVDGTERFLRDRTHPVTEGIPFPEEAESVWCKTIAPDELYLHRTDGPAVMHPDGSVEFWVDGVRVG